MCFDVIVTIHDTPIRVTGTAEPAVPAVLGRAPEHCSPAEGGEIDIASASIGGVDVYGLLDGSGALDTVLDAVEIALCH